VARVLTSVGGINGSGYALRNTDVPLDELGRFQVHRVGDAVGCGGRLRSNGRPVSMQCLRDIGVNVCRSIGLEALRAVTKEERPRFEAQLSVNLVEG